jgi:hypothetical protein
MSKAAVVIAIVAVALLVLVYSVCATGGKADDEMERMYQKRHDGKWH